MWKWKDPPLCKGHLQEQSPGFHHMHKSDKKAAQRMKGVRDGTQQYTRMVKWYTKLCYLSLSQTPHQNTALGIYIYLIKADRIKVTTTFSLTVACAVSSAPT